MAATLSFMATRDGSSVRCSSSGAQAIAALSATSNPQSRGPRTPCWGAIDPVRVTTKCSSLLISAATFEPSPAHYAMSVPARALLLARAKDEGVPRVGPLVGHGETQALDQPQHTAFDTRVAEARASNGSARHGTAGIDVPRDVHGALEVRIPRGSTFVARPERTHAGLNHAVDLGWCQTHACLGRIHTLHLAFAAFTGARTVAVARPSQATTTGTATARATGTGTEAAAFAGPPTRIERARAERNATFLRAAASAARTAQTGARAAAQHDLVRAQPAECVRHRTDGTERLRDLFADVTGEHFGHSAEARLRLTSELGLFCNAPFAEHAFVAFDLLAAALLAFVLRARILDALAGVRIGRGGFGGRLFFRLQIELQRELGLTGELERLRDAGGGGDRPDQREPAEHGNLREDERQDQAEVEAVLALHHRRCVRELEEQREVAVLDQPVVARDDRDRRAAACELARVFF